mmetsp:Transcript_44631/g.82640  ORF Transcript_44631/g.82640 Transcript_44631/m.82640 type:complete len:181 (-) Transcript_44631:28-570(-)
MQEISDYTGVEYDERRATQSYMNVLGKKGPMNDNAKFNIIQGDGAGTAEATELSTDLTKGPITETLTITCAYPKPTFYELKVYNDAMSYEHFKVGWAPESVNGGSDFQVTFDFLLLLVSVCLSTLVVDRNVACSSRHFWRSLVFVLFWCWSCSWMLLVQKEKGMGPLMLPSIHRLLQHHD